MAERTLHLAAEIPANGLEAFPDPGLLGLEATRLTVPEEALLATRLFGGPWTDLHASPSEIHMGRKVLSPFRLPSRKPGPLRARPGEVQAALSHGTRTWNELGLPDYMAVERDHLALEGSAVSLLTLDGLPRELGAQALSPLLSMPIPFDLCLRVVPLDSDAVVRYLTRRLRDLRSSRLLGARSDGFAADDAIRDAEALREALYVGATRLWQGSLTLAAWGHDPDEARRHATACLSRLSQGGFLARVPLFRQWDALLSMLPGHADLIRSRHNVTTDALLALLPLIQVTPPRIGILLGRHAQDASPVHFARLSRPNPAALYLGIPGSGKSALGKMELRRVLLSRPSDRALIVDPEGEYEGVATALDGVVISLERDTGLRLSPFVGAARTPGLTADLLAGCLDARAPEAIATIRTALRHFLADAETAGRSPSVFGLGHFVPYLRQRDRSLSDRLADLADGPLRPLLEAGHAPLARVLAISLRGTEPHLLPSLMTLYTHVLLDHLETGGNGLRWLTVDEFHLFLAHETGTRLLVQLTKRARKHGVVLTAITQHITDLLGHPDGQAILAAAGSVVLFEPGIDLRPFAESLHLNATDLDWAVRLRTGRALVLGSGGTVPVDIELSAFERRLAETRPLAVQGQESGQGGRQR